MVTDIRHHTVVPHFQEQTISSSHSPPSTSTHHDSVQMETDEPSVPSPEKSEGISILGRTLINIIIMKAEKGNFVHSVSIG